MIKEHWCSSCGLETLVKKGFRRGKQLYKCNNCGHSDTFIFNKKPFKEEKKKQLLQETTSCETTIEGDTIEINGTIRVKESSRDKAFISFTQSKINKNLYDIQKFKSVEKSSEIIDGEKFIDYDIKVIAKRKNIRNVVFSAWVNEVVSQINSKKISFPPPPKFSIKNGEPHLLEICPFDMHFGKLAWHEETGNDYDVRIAQDLYTKAIEYIISKTSLYNIEKVIMPIGQDFFNIDNANNTTTKGTVQDVDGRLPKVFNAGLCAVKKSIDLCLSAFPQIEIMYVPGNHDRTLSWMLCRALEEYSLSCKNLTVDSSPSARKFVRYGKSIIGFSHGSEESKVTLTNIIQNERRSDWGETEWAELHIGHWHKKSTRVLTADDTQDSLLIRTLPSLSGTDNWHYEKGFAWANKAMEAYLWGKESGPVASISANQKVILKMLRDIKS